MSPEPSPPRWRESATRPRTRAPDRRDAPRPVGRHTRRAGRHHGRSSPCTLPTTSSRPGPHIHFPESEPARRTGKAVKPRPPAERVVRHLGDQGRVAAIEGHRCRMITGRARSSRPAWESHRLQSADVSGSSLPCSDARSELQWTAIGQPGAGCFTDGDGIPVEHGRDRRAGGRAWLNATSLGGLFAQHHVYHSRLAIADREPMSPDWDHHLQRACGRFTAATTCGCVPHSISPDARWRRSCEIGALTYRESAPTWCGS